MVSCSVSFPIPLPDDPKKWDGWNRYKSSNLYERLCLDHSTNPSNELIEEHCRELLRWWQKKLPLKNQPSNPLAQMLRSGLEESSKFLTEARMELLDPSRRQEMDAELEAEAHALAVAEFQKFLSFALTKKTLTLEDESNLAQFGKDHGLDETEIQKLIDASLQDTGSVRAPVVVEAPKVESAAGTAKSDDPNEEFMRMLRLSGLNSDDMTDDQRDAFVNMAENLDIDPGDAEDLIDEYLDEADETTAPTASATPAVVVVGGTGAKASPAKGGVSGDTVVASSFSVDVASERARFPKFQNSLGTQMLLVTSGEFEMGAEGGDAAPNEHPVARMQVSRFYMARHLVTNAEYEKFDPSHTRKRARGTGPNHPVVYVSSLEAIKFCQWLSGKERRRYRLPREAEWEYAAKGTDGRKYPWGNYEGRGDLANFADRNTVFAWSNREIDDGFAESSPVGSFPIGVSPFGLEDIAGNVWEWCLDYYEAYRGVPKTNPRGPSNGTKRIYRGGSWKSRFSSLRTTARGSNLPSYSCNDLGFRIVCECE